MTAYVQVEAGQWVLAYKPEFGPCPGRETLCDAAERLRYGGSGWDCLRHGAEQFDIVRVEHVMPKTVLTCDGRRIHRDVVLAVGSTPSMPHGLRDELFEIGRLADKTIEEETARMMRDFSIKTRADATAKVHALLPHIFGKPT